MIAIVSIENIYNVKMSSYIRPCGASEIVVKVRMYSHLKKPREIKSKILEASFWWWRGRARARPVAER